MKKLLNSSLLPYIKEHRIAFALFFLWLSVQLTLFHFLGIAHGGDTSRYTDAANYILSEGSLPSGRALDYMGYVLFVTAIFFLGLEEAGVVFFQVILTLVASICLYHLTYKLSRDKFASVLSVLLYILAFNLHLWNFHILTDSLFSSMTIISLYLISHLKNYKQLIYVVPVVLWTASIRPSGFVLLLSLILFALAYLWKLKKTKLLLWIFIIFMLSLPIFLYFVNKVANHIEIVDNYLKGEIIWSYGENALSPPNDIFIDPDYEKNSLMGIIAFAVFNFAYICKLALLKLLYFLGHIKPFYSTLHNWLIAITYYPLYILAMAGFSKKTPHFPTKVLLLSYFLGQTAIVMLTFEDWDGRFLEVIMPVVYIFSALGLAKLSYYFPKTRKFFSSPENDEVYS